MDKMKTFWVPPPLRPLPPWGGDIFGRTCLISYGLIIKTASESQVFPCLRQAETGLSSVISIKVFGMSFKVNRTDTVFPWEGCSIFERSCFLACLTSDVKYRP